MQMLKKKSNEAHKEEQIEKEISKRIIRRKSIKEITHLFI